MTRQDYKLIADAIKNSPYIESSATIARSQLIADIAKALKTDNPRFQYSRFLQACGLGESNG